MLIGSGWEIKPTEILSEVTIRVFLLFDFLTTLNSPRGRLWIEPRNGVEISFYIECCVEHWENLYIVCFIKDQDILFNEISTPPEASRMEVIPRVSFRLIYYQFQLLCE